MSTLVKMSNCWKSHAVAHISYGSSVILNDISGPSFELWNNTYRVVLEGPLQISDKLLKIVGGDRKRTGQFRKRS